MRRNPAGSSWRRLMSWVLLVAVTQPVAAQLNYEVHSNGLDATFLGLGAGGSQVPGVDGIGWWVDGCDLVGNKLTVLGAFGYRQASFGLSQCVLGPPPAQSIDFPLIVVIEYDNANKTGQPYTFLRPTCSPGGVPAGMTTGGVIPFGFAPNTSVNFLVSGLPSGIGWPSNASMLIPEQGLLQCTTTATLMALGTVNLPIASTGFCWTVQFAWLPTALIGLDRIDGWWYWMTNSSNGNQYWGLSTDEMNLLQSRTVASDAGVTALITFFSNVDIDFNETSLGPSVNDALHPGGTNGAGPYYTTSSAPACSNVGAVIPNGGFDLGRHLGWSSSGVGGAINSNTGVSNQDPAGSALSIPAGPTLGFVSWNNTSYGLLENPTAPSRGGTAVVWLQIAWHKVLRLASTEAVNPSVLGSPSFLQRVPGGLEFTGPDPWPQPVTIDNLLLFAHDTCDSTGDASWPDPWGFGTLLGSPPLAPVPYVGTTSHIPLGGQLVCLFGIKVMVSYGTIGTVDSSALAPGFADLTWNPAVADVGNTHTRILYD